MHNLHLLLRDGAGTPLSKPFMISEKREGDPVLVHLVFAENNMNTNFDCNILGNFCLTL